MSLVFVDCEGINVLGGTLTEFGAVEYKTRKTFHGDLRLNGESTWRQPTSEYRVLAKQVFTEFAEWLAQFKGRPVFVSDNPAYDWQGINYAFIYYLGRNPFGHSARRIGDFYAGLVGDFYKSSEWKDLRETAHDHNPVNDAMGNVEAFASMLAGKRVG